MIRLNSKCCCQHKSRIFYFFFSSEFLETGWITDDWDSWGSTKDEFQRRYIIYYLEEQLLLLSWAIHMGLCSFRCCYKNLREFSCVMASVISLKWKVRSSVEKEIKVVKDCWGERRVFQRGLCRKWDIENSRGIAGQRLHF